MKQEMITQEQIEQKAFSLYPVRTKKNKQKTGKYDSNLPRRKAYIEGALYILNELIGDYGKDSD